jgi:PQQ-like domain
MFSPGLLLPTARRHLIPLAKPDRRQPPAGSPSPSANSARFTGATVRSLIDEQGFADQAAWCRWPSRFRAHARRHRALRCNDGNLYSFSAATLAALWSYAVPGNPQIGSTAVSCGTVYVTTTSPGAGELFAISTNAHAQEWSFKAASTINAPAIAGNVVYAVAQNGVRYALNSTTGILLWSKQLHDGTAEPRPARSCGATGPETPCRPPRSSPTASSTSAPVPAARRHSRPSKQRLESVRGPRPAICAC